MNRKPELINHLLEGLDSLEVIFATSSPFNIEPQMRQLAAWIEHVSGSLLVAGMTEELDSWKSIVSGVRMSALDPSMFLHMKGMRAFLIALINQAESPNNDNDLFPIEIIDGTKRYIHVIANQVNKCYRAGCYDASAVMLRKLIENLIIECFERYNIQSEIKNSQGNYIEFEKIITAFKNKDGNTWHLSRNMRKHLKCLDEVHLLGNKSAHDRYHSTKKVELEGKSESIRSLVEGLVNLQHSHP